MSSTSKSFSASSRTPTKRLLTELSAFASSPPSSHPLITSLSPSPSSLLVLHAILSGSSLPPHTGYTSGRWLLKITIPPNYPNAPPNITFVTKICHANVAWETGEVCLDVLKENWTPVLGVVGALESVGRLLGEPGVDSPLNVDLAGLVRQGDAVGARSLVGYWCEEERWEGGLGGLAGEGEGAYEGSGKGKGREKERR